MNTEKGYVGNVSPEYDTDNHNGRFVDHPHHLGKDTRLDEAADIYGDVATGERYGYVARGLKSRHIQFIALGGSIGTGLFLGIGKAFSNSGPLSVLLGYTFTGIAVYGMMTCLGEMATWLPLPGAIPQFCARYADEALGFAVGWNNWYNSAITLCVEISAAAVVIQYWEGARDINVSAWISIIIVLVLCLNVFAVAIYGEAEFVFASIKIITIVGLLIMAFIVDLGGGPTHDRLGFRYWKNPGAMAEVDGTGATGRFLGLFATLVNAAFSYGGVELVAVAAGEAENPRKNIPKAVRRVFWRILCFYVLGTLAIGVMIPYTDENLLDAIKNGLPGAAASPWVIAIRRAQIPVLPSIINAVILTSASSSANAFLYVGSRYLFALAQNRQAPRFLLKCSKSGVPIYCVLITASISLLTFLSVREGGPASVFLWLQNLVSITTLLTWITIVLAYIQFYKALKAQGIDRNTLVFKSPFQPYTAYATIIFFSLIVFFNGFDIFVHGHWSATDFVAAYIGLPIIVVLFVFWKIFKRTTWHRAIDVDLHTGKAALDAMDALWPERVPRNLMERVWFWIA